jgi:hypothetical protein
MALNQAVILAADWSAKIKTGLVKFLGVPSAEVVVTKGEGANTPLYDAKLLSQGTANFACRIVGSLDDDNVDVVAKVTAVGGKTLPVTTDITSFRRTPKPHEFTIPDIIVLQDLDQFV